MTANDKFKKIVGTLFAVIGVGFLAYVVYVSAPSFGAVSDLPEYYAPARMIVEGRGTSACNLQLVGQAQHQYFPGMHDRVVPLYVPPPGMALLSPLGLIPVSAIIVIWKLAMGLSLGAAVCFMRKTANLDYRQTCYLIAGIAFSDACFEALKIDQLAPLLLLAFAGSVYFLHKNKDIPAGLMLSLLILKPQQIIPFGAYLVAMKRWKTLAVACGVVLLLTALSFVQIRGGYHDYIELVRSPFALQYQQPQLTPTFRGQMLRLLPSMTGTIFGVSTVLELAAIALGFALGWRWRHQEKSILLGVLTVMPFAIVLSLHCHDYDLLLLVPTFLFFFMDTIVDFSALFKMLVLLGGMTFMTGVAVQIHYDYLLKGGPINVWFWQLLAFAIGVLIVSLRQVRGSAAVAPEAPGAAPQK